MIEIETPQALMVWLINFMADKFGSNAIIKGGMELRLLDCPRHTNDLDYIFIPYSSKKEVHHLIVNALTEIPGMKVQHTLNSKCLRCICEYNGIRAQLEINVAKDCETQELSTASLSKAFNQQGRIVRGMRFDIALAHKIAAWNERGLIRDLYDCYFMVHILDVRPHIPVLKQRLARSLIRSGRKTRNVSMSVTEFIDKLRKSHSGLSQSMVDEQLRDFLEPDELPGLEKKMKIGLKKLEDSLVNTCSSD